MFAYLWTAAWVWPVDWKRLPGSRWWLAWTLWLGLSLIASDQPLKSLPDLARWLGLLAFFALARTYWKDGDVGLWVKALCLAGPVLGLGAVFLSPIDYPMTGFMPPYYNYTMFALAAACAASAAMAAGSAGPLRWLFALDSAFCLGVILAARSRGGLLALAAAVLVAAYRRGQLAMLAILLLAFGGLLALSPWPIYSHFMKVEKLGGMVRPQIWQAALRVTADHPLLGEGPGNFEQGFLRHSFPSGLQVRYGFIADRSHSDLLSVSAETGIVGLILFLLALAACVRKFAAVSIEREAAILAAAAMAGQCLVDNFLHLPALGMLFFAALACSARVEPSDFRGGKSRALVLSALVLSLAATAPRWLVETARKNYWSETDPFKRLSHALLAAQLYPAEAGSREMLAKAWLGLKPPDLNRALQELELAERLSPHNALYPSWRGEIMRHGRRWEDVERLASLALEIEPHCRQARILRAEAYAETDRRDLARSEMGEFKRSVESVTNPDLTSGYDRAILSYDKERAASLVRSLR